METCLKYLFITVMFASIILPACSGTVVKKDEAKVSAPTIKTAEAPDKVKDGPTVSKMGDKKTAEPVVKSEPKLKEFNQRLHSRGDICHACHFLFPTSQPSKGFRWGPNGKYLPFGYR